MSEIISFFVILSILILLIKLIGLKNFYEKLIMFYFIFNNAILFVLTSQIVEIELLTIVSLFFLEIASIIFLIIKKD
jgi:hypothetical protein